MHAKEVLFVLTALIGMAGLIGCSGPSHKQVVQPGQQVTLSGMMQQGTLSAMGMASQGNSLHTQGTPLANYKLYCVTFESAPSAATGTADSTGSFSLTIKSYTPFGCFVLNANGQHVADLLFGGLGSSAGVYSGSIELTGNVDIGTITVDQDSGRAVADVGGVGGVSGSNNTGTLFDPTGAWNFSCTSPSGDPVYTCPQNPLTSLYLDRISGIFSSDGNRHYAMGVWQSQANYNACGNVEGLCSTSGCMTGQGPVSGTTVALDQPDGPFQFAYDSVWQPAFDAQTQNFYGECGAPTTISCSQVTNAQGWGYYDATGAWVFYQPGQCQQMCYADNFYDFEYTTSYCMENRNYIWDDQGFQYIPNTALTDGSSTPFIDFDGHNPASRFMFGELIYSSSTSASEVSTDYWIDSIYDPVNKVSYSCSINEVTKLAFSDLDANTLVGTVDQYLTLSATSPTECSSNAIPNNYALQDLQHPMHMMFQMTR